MQAFTSSIPANVALPCSSCCCLCGMGFMFSFHLCICDSTWEKGPIALKIEK